MFDFIYLSLHSILKTITQTIIFEEILLHILNSNYIEYSTGSSFSCRKVKNNVRLTAPQ